MNHEIKTTKSGVLYIGHKSDISAFLGCNLKQIGFETSNIKDCATSMKYLNKIRYSVVIIEDKESNRCKIKETCKAIRSNGNFTITIVLLNSNNIELEEELFDIGVNDVVTQDHSTPNLIYQRIKTHLRNKNRLINSANIFNIAGTIIDLEQRQVKCNGVTKKLSGTTYDLLKYFLENSNKIITRKELHNSYIWNDSICSEPEEGGKTIDVTVSKLRKIIESNPANPQIIESIRGQGWKFNSDIYS